MVSQRFTKYIESSTAHGVVHIFIGKSHIRKIFWLFIVLASTTACLYNCIDRIRFLASGPTATTITLNRQKEIDFPAVTICNLNMLRRDYLDSLGLSEIIQNLLLLDEDELGLANNCTDQLQNEARLPNKTYEDMFIQGTHDLKSFIIGCQYLGQECDVNLFNFVPTLTRLGICYVFNGLGSPVLKTSVTGARLGLRLIVNVSQDQYQASPNLDAGVKIAVHHQLVPPEPDDQGVGVPTGTNAFISLKQLNVIDDTKSNCISKEEISSLNFLQLDYNYSSAACAIDCLYTQVANSCGCKISSEYSPDREPFTNLPLCTIRDTCCVLSQQTVSMSCSSCIPSCNSTFYELTTSYSSFPANFAAQKFSLVSSNDNLLMANIFYESLSITEEMTSSSYNAVSLLSDIGGQLGLFLGVSVISVIEFLFWVMDELKDRCCGVSESKIKRFCCKRRLEDDLDGSGDPAVDKEHTKYYGMTLKHSENNF